ncbi:MAG: segregation/condensation protein A [Oligoflexia bacterium]|nr:segregation/condensation protein A [Oligoflexia bacterium]
MTQLNVQLNTFEGPLSLLLYLIKKNEIDIYDIPIHDITKQYLEYIQIMKELNLELAGEFIAMAATLIYIKSRMLVPQYDEQGEEIEVDPRKELVQKLLEYQKFQEAGKQLYKRPLLGRDLWARGGKETLPQGHEEIIVDEGGLFALISHFRHLMKNAKKSTHEVRAKGLSISAKLLEIRHRFTVGARIEIQELLPQDYTKTDVIITFLSILELCRLKFARVYQTEPFAPLYIETIREITSDVVSRVQEFDAVDAAQTADRLMIEAEAELDQMTMAEEVSHGVTSDQLENDSEIRAVEAGELV